MCPARWPPRPASEPVRAERTDKRGRHLDRIADTKWEPWCPVETLIEAKRPKEYERAVARLVGLPGLSTHRQ